MRSILSVVVLGTFCAMPAMAQDPYDQADDTWITLRGEVETVNPQSFRLDYGEGLVTVEFDDWDMDNDAFVFVPGDSVTVSGRIDDDFFETTTIEAANVYVDQLNSYFYANPVDEEDPALRAPVPALAAGVTVRGTVMSVSEESFTINEGMRELTVDVSDMAYDPLDDEGYQKIEQGDVVSVHGILTYDFFEGRSLDATTISTLWKSPLM